MSNPYLPGTPTPPAAPTGIPRAPVGQDPALVGRSVQGAPNAVTPPPASLPLPPPPVPPVPPAGLGEVGRLGPGALIGAFFLRFLRGWIAQNAMIAVTVATIGVVEGDSGPFSGTVSIMGVYGVVSFVLGLPTAALLDLVIRDALPPAGHVAVVGVLAAIAAIALGIAAIDAAGWAYAAAAGIVFALSRLAAGFRRMPTWRREPVLAPGRP